MAAPSSFLSPTAAWARQRPEQLAPQPGIGAKFAQPAFGDQRHSMLPHAARRHAGVPGLYNHRDAAWLQRFVQRMGDLPRQAFLRSEEHTSELQSLMRISYAAFCVN